MFVRVPVTYENTVVRKGCQKSEPMTFGEWVDVHVVDVADAEAPVATRRKVSRGDLDAPGGVLETRWFDGSHWKPMLETYSGKPALHVAANDLVVTTGEGGHSRLVSDPSDARRLVAGKIVPESELAVRATRSSGRKEAVERAHRVASDLLFVDGVAWQRSCEPVILVTIGSAGFDTYVSVDVKDETALAYEDRSGAFSALRWDDAMEYAGTIRTDRDWLRRERLIDVLVPESIAFDAEIPAAIEAMKRAVDWRKPDLSEADRVEVVAWLEFRDAVKTAARERSEESVADMLAALEAHRATSRGFTEWMDNRLDAAVNRWNLRPLAIEHDQPARLGS